MQSIRRGTTPTIHFTTAVEQTDVNSLYITFVQNNAVILEKSDTDVTWDETGLYVVLTQDETLKFAEGQACVQIRAKMASTLATATQILPLMVETVLKNGVI